MDTFIVRIYRRIARSADEPAGTVEHVESGDRVGFASARELLDRLFGASVTTCRSPASEPPPLPDNPRKEQSA
jgi:hypothetical protein